MFINWPLDHIRQLIPTHLHTHLVQSLHLHTQTRPQVIPVSHDFVTTSKSLLLFVFCVPFSTLVSLRLIFTSHHASWRVWGYSDQVFEPFDHRTGGLVVHFFMPRVFLFLSRHHALAWFWQFPCILSQDVGSFLRPRVGHGIAIC